MGRSEKVVSGTIAILLAVFLALILTGCSEERPDYVQEPTSPASAGVCD